MDAGSGLGAADHLLVNPRLQLLHGDLEVGAVDAHLEPSEIKDLAQRVQWLLSVLVLCGVFSTVFGMLSWQNAKELRENFSHHTDDRSLHAYALESLSYRLDRLERYHDEGHE